MILSWGIFLSIDRAIISPMHTPAGKECRYFYGNYFRGKNEEECRLILQSKTPQAWKPDLCYTCPVPGIIQANACENMVLTASVERPLLIFKPIVNISAYCTKTSQDVQEPHIGCGECHIIPSIFTGENIDPDVTD